jgi:hypothetical protein
MLKLVAGAHPQLAAEYVGFGDDGDQALTQLVGGGD